MGCDECAKDRSHRNSIQGDSRLFWGPGTKAVVCLYGLCFFAVGLLCCQPEYGRFALGCSRKSARMKAEKIFSDNISLENESNAKNRFHSS